MLAKVPENTPAIALEDHPNRKQKPGMMAVLSALKPQATRLCLWVGAAVLLMGAMKSVANHFYPEGKRNEDSAPRERPRGNSSEEGSDAGKWWDPRWATLNGSMPDSSTDGDTSAGGGSAIPSNHGTQFSGGSLILNSGLSGGPSASREAYEILGLRTSSTPASMFPNPAADVGIAPSALSFSLSGDMNLVPIDNLATGGVSAALAPVPEPSAGLMLGIGLAGLVLQRRRQTVCRA